MSTHGRRLTVCSNVLIVIMDIALLAMQYQQRHVIEQALKVVIYSVKLKLEFAILNKLIFIAQRGDNEVYFKDDSDQAGRADSSLRGGTEGRQTEAWKDFEKGEAEHVERLSSGATDPAGSEATTHHLPPAETVDQQRRRRQIEIDDYAAACRDVAG